MSPKPTPPPVTPSPETLHLVAELLRLAYVPETSRPSGRPLDELIATILSQHTSDRNSHRAFAQLKVTWSDWAGVAAAPEEAVAQAIRPGGLAQQKAPRILAVLAEIPRDPDGLPSLDFLADLDCREAFDRLQQFGGVGPKTAACTLLFAYGWPAFPVDVHVHRVAGRLGWAGPRESAGALQARMMDLVPPQLTYVLHMGLVRHGRTVCRPSKPRCADCVISDHCGRYGVDPGDVDPPG